MSWAALKKPQRHLALAHKTEIDDERMPTTYADYSNHVLLMLSAHGDDQAIREKYGQAEKHFTERIKADPKAVDAYSRRGDARRGHRLHLDARRAHAARARPDHHLARGRRAQLGRAWGLSPFLAVRGDVFRSSRARSRWIYLKVRYVLAFRSGNI